MEEVKVYSLYSGSKGNSVLVDLHGKFVLIDFGVSPLQLRRRLARFDLSIDDISAVLLTHGHSDHIAGFKRESEVSHLPVYANFDALERIDVENKIEVKSDVPFELFGYKVTPFLLPHDALCYGYKFENATTFSYATDLGCIGAGTEAILSGSNKIFLEANHDLDMLIMGRYPEMLKRRIMSDGGHLSNESAGALCARLMERGATEFILGHLSEENNIPELCEASVSEKLARAGAKRNSDYVLSVSKRDGLERIV